MEIWPECVASLQFFLGLSTQWRVDGMSGQARGLDYAGVDAAMRLSRVKSSDRPALFEDIRVMERAALEGFSARAEA